VQFCCDNILTWILYNIHTFHEDRYVCYSLRVALDRTKSLNVSSRTLFNSRISLDEKDDKKDTEDQKVDVKANPTENTDKKREAEQKLKDLLRLMSRVS